MAFLLFLLLGWGAQLMRVYTVESIYGDAAGCNGCLAKGVLGSDAAFWLLWLILAWAGYALTRTLPARVLRFVAALLLLYYLLDIYVMTQFSTRMYVPWLLIVGSTPGPVVEHLAATIEWWRWGLVFAALTLLFWLAWRQPQRPATSALAKTTLGLSLAACAGAILLAQPVYYVHGWVVGNVFDPRGSNTYATAYGEETLSKLAESTIAGPECSDFSGEYQKRDIMILILESWSPYQSDFLTGLNDWTPRLDRLMKEHGHFERMMASGYSTSHGLMALLTGLPVMATLVPPLERRSLQPAWGWSETLPKQLSRSGYETAFLTSGDLSFTGKGDWLTHIGFDYVEGHDHSFYDGMTRLHFRAAPDAALYERATEFLSDRDPAAPSLALVVESVSSHNPFIHPETRERDEEAVFRYIDEAAESFIESMLADEFVQQGGLLVVVSDHRAMKAISPGELDVLGDEAHARIPMMILGKDLPPTDPSGLWAQSDLAPSLSALTTGSACGYPGWQNLFAPAAEARCVFHTRGDDRNLVEVYCQHSRGTVQLAGDESRFVSNQGLTRDQQKAILLELASLRLIADAHNDEFFDIR